jgi:hypothetical protein
MKARLVVTGLEYLNPLAAPFKAGDFGRLRRWCWFRAEDERAADDRHGQDHSDDDSRQVLLLKAEEAAAPAARTAVAELSCHGVGIGAR